MSIEAEATLYGCLKGTLACAAMYDRIMDKDYHIFQQSDLIARSLRN